MSNNETAMEKMRRARIKAMMEFPFFGQIAFHLTLKEVPEGDKRVKTAATDMKHIFFNPAFVNKLTTDEVLFLYLHEVYHCVLMHVGARSASKNADYWNMATDYIINYDLKETMRLSMIDGGLYDSRYTSEMTADEVYEDLLKNQVSVKPTLDQHIEPQAGGGTGDDDGDDQGESGGSGGDQDGDENGGSKVNVNSAESLSPGELEEARERIQDAIRQAATAIGSEEAGRLPGAARRVVAALTEHYLDWRELIVQHVQSHIKGDFTYQRPSRRTHSVFGGDIVFPDRELEKTINVTAWVDVSGSMTDEMLQEIMSELYGIVSTFEDYTIDVGFFDTRCVHFETYTPENGEEILKLELRDGGGGTDFDSMYDYMKEHDIVPDKMIVFTDGYPCGSWGDEAYYSDVLWIIHYDKHVVPPFGQRVIYDVERAKNMG